jgi:hypothetical protein
MFSNYEILSKLFPKLFKIAIYFVDNSKFHILHLIEILYYGYRIFYYNAIWKTRAYNYRGSENNVDLNYGKRILLKEWRKF